MLNQFYRNGEEITVNQLIVTLMRTNGNSYPDEGLTNGQQYCYQVTAKVNKVESDPYPSSSTEVCATPEAKPVVTKPNPPITYTGADRYEIDDINGTATDKVTSLTWMRCSLGQTWNSSTKTCDGKAVSLTYREAMDKQKSEFADWRILSIGELTSLV